MFNILKYLGVLSVLFVLFSCTKTTNVENVVDPWKYTGTPTLSFDVDGTHYEFDSASVAIANISGYYVFSEQLATNVTIGFALVNTIGTGEHTTPSPNNITYTDLASGFNGSGLNGSMKILIIQHNSSVLEGKFYGEIKSISTSSVEKRVISKGYFKIMNPP
jgi:hypothetical protein